jgi:hypothetical protein
MDITVLGGQKQVRSLFDSGCGLTRISSTSERPGLIRALLQERTLAIPVKPAIRHFETS